MADVVASRSSSSPSASLPLVRLRYRDADVLLDAWAKAIAEGSLWVAGVPPHRADVQLQLQVGERTLTPLRAAVVQRDVGYGLRFVASSELQAIVEHASALRRQGRRASTSVGTSRADERYEVALTARLGSLPELQAQFASNISRGGIFVRTTSAPPVGSAVSLTLELPGGEVVNLPATVVHSTETGVGLAFRAITPEAFAPIERLLSRFSQRRPHVLLIHEPGAWRDTAVAAMSSAGLVVEVAEDGLQGFRRLLDGLFEVDLVMAEVGGMPLDGLELLDRIRKHGGELGLRVMLLFGEPPSIETPGNGPTWIASKLQPIEALVRRVRAQVGLI